MEIINIEKLRAQGQFTVKMRQILIEQEDKQIKELINFALALMSIFGLIAGFGFTAFSYIKLYFLFFFGEVIIIGSVFYLGLSVKKLLVGWATDTSNRIYNIAEDAAKIKKAILEKDEDKIKEITGQFEHDVKDTSPQTRIIRANIVDVILRRTFWAGLVGIVFILFSFIYFSARDTSWHHIKMNQSVQSQFE
jgi:hypothetical protein